MTHNRLLIFALSSLSPFLTSLDLRAQYRLASFRADVTIPIGHRCMGVLPTKSKTITDRLYANGFVLLGHEEPIVLCAVDWCEIRNGAYDAWREALASAVNTKRERVLVCSLHQHDAPVTDSDAAKLLRDAGLAGELYDEVYNDGSPDSRIALTERLYNAMVGAWKDTRLIPLSKISFRNSQFELEFHPDSSLTQVALNAVLADASKSVETRILAAMGLASRQRVGNGQKIDMPCIDFGEAKILLFPGESFVGYQLMAQQRCPDTFIVSIGYGECWPGYVPTEAAFRDSFHDKWLWVAPGSEARIRRAMNEVLSRNHANEESSED